MSRYYFASLSFFLVAVHYYMSWLKAVFRFFFSFSFALIFFRYNHAQHSDNFLFLFLSMFVSCASEYRNSVVRFSFRIIIILMMMKRLQVSFKSACAKKKHLLFVMHIHHTPCFILISCKYTVAHFISNMLTVVKEKKMNFFLILDAIR